MATYDAVKWHILTKEKVPLNVALLHFRVILDWLRRKDLLTDVGQEKAKKLNRDFELTDDMLTNLGNAILVKGYPSWVQTIDYKTRPRMDILERLHMLLKNKISNDKNTDLEKEVKDQQSDSINVIQNVKTSTSGPQTNPNMVQPVNESLHYLLKILYNEISTF